MLEKLFKKNELWFALVFIIVYVVGNSAAMELSEKIGIEMSASIPLNILILAVMLIFIKKNGLSGYYGLNGVKTELKNVLFFIPLIVISTVNLWCGIDPHYQVAGTIIYIVAMTLAGATEEFLFRAFLFNAMRKKSIKAAIIVSSITFGLGHIVNLFNGSGMQLVENVCQLFYAVAVGFLLVAVLYTGKSLIPCIICHAVFNSLSAFSNEAGFEKIQIQVSIALCVISAVSAFIILKRGEKISK